MELLLHERCLLLFREPPWIGELAKGTTWCIHNCSEWTKGKSFTHTCMCNDFTMTVIWQRHSYRGIWNDMSVLFTIDIDQGFLVEDMHHVSFKASYCTFVGISFGCGWCLVCSHSRFKNCSAVYITARDYSPLSFLTILISLYCRPEYQNLLFQREVSSLLHQFGFLGWNYASNIG